MTERDWFGELVDAVGDDPARPQPLVPSDALPGAEADAGPDIDGWTRQLAEVFGHELPIPAPVHHPPAPRPRAEEPAVSDAAAEPATVEARLARVEALLRADLESLGPAVLADSVARLAAQLDGLRGRVAAMVDAIPDDVSGRSPGGDGSIGALREMVERLDERLLAQSRFLLHQADVRADLGAAIAAVGGRVDEFADRLERLADRLGHRLDPADPPRPESAVRSGPTATTEGHRTGSS